MGDKIDVQCTNNMIIINKMKGLGTVINALAIIAGGVLGILCKNI